MNSKIFVALDRVLNHDGEIDDQLLADYETVKRWWEKVKLVCGRLESGDIDESTALLEILGYCHECKATAEEIFKVAELSYGLRGRKPVH